MRDESSLNHYLHRKRIFCDYSMMKLSEEDEEDEEDGDNRFGYSKY